MQAVLPLFEFHSQYYVQLIFFSWQTNTNTFFGAQREEKEQMRLDRSDFYPLAGSSMHTNAPYEVCFMWILSLCSISRS